MWIAVDQPFLKDQERKGRHELPRKAFPVGAVRHSIQVGNLPTLDEDHRQDLQAAFKQFFQWRKALKSLWKSY